MKFTRKLSFTDPLWRMLYILAGLFILVSCSQSVEEDRIYVALSKGAPGEHYSHYAKWLQKADSTIIYVDMYNIPMDSAIEMLHKCSGLVLTGGPDIYPGRYNREEDTTVCEEIDFYRDSLEHELLINAQDMKLPVLGICRGAQFINVFFGGTLVADIPTQTESTVEHRCENPYQCSHEIKVMETSNLRSIAQESRGMVNSNHHQAVREIAPNLLITARTEDGLAEAVEWKESLGRPFLLGVQWHPERMEFDSPFSGAIAKAFVSEVNNYHQNIKGQINYERR